MKGIIEFDLPEERDEFQLCQDAWKYRATIDDAFEYLRQQLKYTDRADSEVKVLEEIRSKLLDTMVGYELSR